MRSLKLGEDRFIIPFNNKYFVVNEYTKDLIETLNNSEDLQDFANKKKLDEQTAYNLVSKLDNEIDDCDYYEANISLPVPLKIQWKMTMRCNLRCKHCYLGELSQKCLSRDELLKIAKEINDFGVMEVTLTGGEVFTVDCIDEIIKYFYDNEIKMVVFTNALLAAPHKEFLQSLENKDLIKFIVSVDGTEKEHENIRGKGTYQKTLESIKMLTSIGYKVSVNMVLNKNNYKTLYDLVGQLNQVGVSNLQLSELIPMGNATKDLCMNDDDFKQLQEIFRKIHKEYKTSNIFYSAEDDGTENEIFLLTDDKLQSFGQEKWKCGAGLGKGTILYNGDVVCCPFMENYKLGNVLTTPLNKVWDSENRYKFLKMIAKDNNGHRKCIVLRRYQ